MALVAAKHDDDNGSSSGSAYVFDLSAGKLLAKLTPSDGAAGDFLGDNFIALNGNRALIGSHLDDDNGKDSGSVYIFDLITGQQLKKITPDDRGPADHFGNAVALNGKFALIGSDDHDTSMGGAAYVFDVTTGEQLYKLTSNDGVEGDRFGYLVAFSGNKVLIGARGDDDKGVDSGSAYVFEIIP